MERAPGDFLKKDAKTPLRASYLAAGVDLRIETNFEPILRYGKSSLLVNLRDGYAAGRFTPELAADAKFWKTVLFPSLLSIAGPSVGLLAGEPKLIQLSSHDIRERVGWTTPFKDDAGSKEERAAILQALSQLPSYRLLYGDDPSVAAVFFRGVLTTHHPMENLL